MAKSIQPPQINQQIYTVMKQLYSRYTGQEIADVIGVIRREIQEEQAQAELKAELKRLKTLVKDE